MIRIFFFTTLCLVSYVKAQEMFSDRVKGLRIYGQVESQLPVAYRSTTPITIEFDMTDEQSANLEFRFIHCDRDWKKTTIPFVNDSPRMKSKSELVPEPAPRGVQGYRLHYKISVPGYPVFDEFPFSGNYELELWDQEREELLAQGRFFVAEDLVAPLMRIANRQEPSVTNPYYQVNKVSVGINVPPPDSGGTTVYYSHLFTTVDIYKNREISRAHRVDLDDRSPHTFIEGYGLEKMAFIIDNILPGNEYRNLDLRSVDDYPAETRHRPRSGADLSRFLLKSRADNDGGSAIIRGNRYADYLEFQFELLWDSNGGDSIYVVGDFNGWIPEGPMVYTGDRYVWSKWLRRGAYDYQYVLNKDWITLEGNDWRTINNYTAFVYYKDPRFGGFDRILGVARAKNPGGNEATSR